MTTVTTAGSTLETRYRDLMQRVDAAARRSGRRASDILVVAVTKYAEMDQVRELVELGHRDLGESRVQQMVQRAAMAEELAIRRRTLAGVVAAHEAEKQIMDPDDGPRRPASRPDGVRWHMIGRLQRNKVKKCLEVARLIHSVDSLRLAEEIQAAAFRRDQVVDVLVQVNCSGEGQKAGCAVAAARHLCDQIETMVHVRARGLMTMAPMVDNPEDARLTFERCREVFDDIRKHGVGGEHFNILSMGMSHDYEVAIDCGSNLIRVGSALFGEPRHDDLDADGDDEG